MELQFIDNANIDAVARKAIRSQAMRGKNAGKKRQRIRHERRKLAVLTSKPTEMTEESISSSDDDIVEWAVTKAAAYRYWDDYSMYKYPRELEWEMRRALHFFMIAATDIMYPQELCYDVQCPVTAFFELFQTSEAFFHCFVGIAEGMRCILMSVDGPTELGLRSLANTYRCINADLETNKTPSWGVIASVMSLTMHENLFGMTGKSKLHLQALERMVHMRGGIVAFEGHVALLHKICRSDIEYALQTGTRPRFYRDNWPLAEIEKQLAIVEAYTTAKLNFTDPIVAKVYKDCIDISTILNTEKIDPSQMMIDGRVKPRIKGTSFQEILISILYRLLDAYPLDCPAPIAAVDSAGHAGMLCLMTTMMIRGSPLHHQYYKMLRTRLYDSLIALEKQHAEFKFWICYVGGASVFDNAEDWQWLGPQIGSLASELGISTLRDARQVLIKFPWVRYFHDEATGSVFWNALGQWQTATADEKTFLYWPNTMTRLKPYLQPGLI